MTQYKKLSCLLWENWFTLSKHPVLIFWMAHWKSLPLGLWGLHHPFQPFCHLACKTSTKNSKQTTIFSWINYFHGPWPLQDRIHTIYHNKFVKIFFFVSSPMTSPFRHLPPTFHQKSAVLEDLAMSSLLPYLMVISGNFYLTYWWHWAQVTHTIFFKTFSSADFRALLDLILPLWACTEPCQNVGHIVPFLSSVSFSGLPLHHCESQIIIMPYKSPWAVGHHCLSDQIYTLLSYHTVQKYSCLLCLCIGCPSHLEFPHPPTTFSPIHLAHFSLLYDSI